MRPPDVAIEAVAAGPDGAVAKRSHPPTSSAPVERRDVRRACPLRVSSRHPTWGEGGWKSYWSPPHVS